MCLILHDQILLNKDALSNLFKTKASMRDAIFEDINMQRLKN